MAVCIYHDILSSMNNVSHFLKWTSDLARLEPRALEPLKLVSIPQVTQPPFIPLNTLANHVSQPTSGLPQTEPDPPITQTSTEPGPPSGHSPSPSFPSNTTSQPI